MTSVAVDEFNNDGLEVINAVSLQQVIGDKGDRVMRACGVTSLSGLQGKELISLWGEVMAVELGEDVNQNEVAGWLSKARHWGKDTVDDLVGVDRSRVKTFEEYSQVDAKKMSIPEPRQHTKMTRSSDHRAPKTAEGKDIKRVVRGVMHPEPTVVVWGALVAFLLGVSGIILLVGVPLAMWLLEDLEPIWYAVVLGVFMLSLVLYLFIGLRVRCRICNCPAFFSRRCHKHVRAHRIKGLGYVVPTAIHVLLFRWFRCMYCGTSVRIKE